MTNRRYCIGVDFGTDSVRSVVVDAGDGQEIASAVYAYPRWKSGLFCNALRNQFRQHPLDHIEGLEKTIRECLDKAPPGIRENVIAIGVDTTGATPVAVDHTGMPLSLRPEFAEDPDAMFILWKDHTAVEEMDRINTHAQRFGGDYLRYAGGIYSSEWFWSKLLHILTVNDRVRNACSSWVEHCDWIPFLLTGGRQVADIKRSVCAAGHKALWSPDWGGLPPAEFFSSLDPLLTPYSNLFATTFTADKAAGRLCAVWAEKLGLHTDVIVSVGALDAHMGAVGGQIEPYYLSKIIGTSTCDMLVAPPQEVEGKFVPGICGIVPGSIIPGLIGMEAGQSAFGDIFAWFRDLLAWPVRALGLSGEVTDSLIAELAAHAMRLPLDDSHELSIDWFNGRRTPDANPHLKGAITGLSLGSDAPRIFRSLAEAACFGSYAIIGRFVEKGIPVRGLIGVGGVAQKSPFIMQMLADITGIPIRVNRAEQICALGAAMFAATAAGVYDNVEQAMTHMGQGFDKEYVPDREKHAYYKQRFERYKTIAATLEQLT
ncbi:MAG: ribulokinase [Chitinophagaceae bacterium]|nr:ribulokinase [Chitinophagaceae bacterium]